METIKSKRDFERVFSGGRRYGGRLVSITVLKGDEGDAGKVAFVAAKRLGNAVYRNRCKRVLREAARAAGLPIKGSSIILFATKSTHGSSPSEVLRSLEGLLARAGV